VPEAVRIAEAVVRLAPDAWVINFTNPAGMVTEAMQAVLGARVVGICDSPVALARRAATALGLDPARTRPDYVGLNHLGWLRGLVHDGEDVLPRLLADGPALRGLEEGRLFGPDWVQSLGALPNEYLYYYYFARDAVASIRAEPDTRGDYLLRQQSAFYDAVAAEPARAYPQWQRVRAERDASYMAEVRGEHEERDAEDLAGGGYEGVALEFMAAVMRGTSTTMILNVRNGTTVAGLPPDGVVEVPCHVDAAGAVALSTRAPDPHQLGLMGQVKAVEQLTIRAARSRDVGLATTAFALHPLVDSVTVARELVRGYGVEDLFRGA
jgi:6-phospho-beta-glucosidase